MKLKRIVREVHSQESADLVAAGLAPPVTPASNDNLNKDEKAAFERWVAVFTERMQEERTLVELWGTPQRMALEKVSESRAGSTARRNAEGQWYQIPRDKMVRTREVEDRMVHAQQVFLGDLTRWAERMSLTSQDETIRLFAEHEAFQARVSASRK